MRGGHRADKIADKNAILASNCRGSLDDEPVGLMNQIQQAIAAQRAGNLAQAEQLCRQALAHNARDFDALHILGALCAQRGNYTEAERLLASALAIDPRVPPCLHNYGNVLSRLKRYDEAVRYYKQALALAPNFAPIYSDLGNAQKELGKIEEAIASYKKALALNPNFPGALGNLAQALMDLKRLDEAAGLLQRATALAPNNPHVVKLLGRLALERDELEAALDHYRRAVALKPDQADAYCGIGNALKDLGRQQEAADAYCRAIELDAGKPGFYVSLAECKKFSAGDAHLALMESMAAQELPAADRMALDFALGKAYADLGEHRRAFTHVQAANAAMRATIGYDEKATADFFDRIERIFSPELMAAKAGAGEPSRRPIFVLGMPRSGTTLVEQVLASHPAVHGAGELFAFQAAVETIAARRGGYPDCVAALEPAEIGRVGTDYLKRLARVAPDGERVTDKMPSNFLYAGLIHLALPHAVIVHTVRNPIDTCVSCFTKLFKPGEQSFSYELGELGRYYVRYQQLMQHWRRVLPAGRMLEVRYEDVVGDLEGQARRILAHCGLPWDERCLDFHKTERPVRTASAMQVRQPIYTSAVERWRDYEEFLGPLLGALGGAAEVR
jgi:tetratricopeptide (TPR) repeat protein